VAQRILEKDAYADKITWLHPIVVDPMKGRTDVGLCIDFCLLNKQFIQQINQPLTLYEIVKDYLEESGFFAVFYVLKGYHQVPLEENSKDKTMIWAPFGKYW
jgi:hypothetical protein